MAKASFSLNMQTTLKRNALSAHGELFSNSSFYNCMYIYFLYISSFFVFLVFCFSFYFFSFYYLPYIFHLFLFFFFYYRPIVPNCRGFSTTYLNISSTKRRRVPCHRIFLRPWQEMNSSYVRMIAHWILITRLWWYNSDYDRKESILTVIPLHWRLHLCVYIKQKSRWKA